MAVRQMGADRVKLDDRIQHKPRDILSDYTQYDSEVYAPIARHGVFPDRGSGGFSISCFLFTLDKFTIQSESI